MVNFKTRFFLAYKAFMLQPVEAVETEPMKTTFYLRRGSDCDNIRRSTKCKNEATRCVQGKYISIKISETSSYHVCDACAEQAEKTNTQVDY